MERGTGPLDVLFYKGPSGTIGSLGLVDGGSRCTTTPVDALSRPRVGLVDENVETVAAIWSQTTRENPGLLGEHLDGSVCRCLTDCAAHRLVDHRPLPRKACLSMLVSGATSGEARKWDC